MEDNNNKKQSYYSALTGFRRAVPIILGALAVFIAICYISDGAGALGNGIKPLMLGLFSSGAYAIPVLLLIHAVFYAEDVAKKRILSRTIFSVIAVIFVCAIEYTIVFWGKEPVFSPAEFYTGMTAGGFIGSTVAYGLIKLLGPIGIYILAAAMLAIYVSFFFANKNSAFSRAIFAILGFFTGILALIERGIKAIINSRKRSKEKKLQKEIEKKNQELLDDQFFRVDDGMSELKISELGIAEEKNAKNSVNEVIKENRSAVDEKNDTAENGNNDTHRARSVSLDYGLEHGLFDAIFEKDPKADTPATALSTDIQDSLEDQNYKDETASYGLDESAEKVFTKDFDPFDFATNEKNASKMSSKAFREETSGIGEINRSLSSMTNEEIAMERRRAEFDKRKQMIINRRNQTDSAVNRQQENNAVEHDTAVHDAPHSQKTVEFNVENEPKVIEKAPREGAVFKGTFEKQEHREHETEKAAAHIAEVVAMNNPTYARSANQMITYMKITDDEKNEEPDIPEDSAIPSNVSSFPSTANNISIESGINSETVNTSAVIQEFSPTITSVNSVSDITQTDTSLSANGVGEKPGTGNSYGFDSSTQSTESEPTPAPSEPCFRPYNPTYTDETVDTPREDDGILRVERSVLCPTPESSTVLTDSRSDSLTAEQGESSVTNENYGNDSKEVGEASNSMTASMPSTESKYNERDKKYTVLSEEMQILDQNSVAEEGDGEVSFTFEEEPVEENPLYINTEPVSEEGTVFSFGDEDENDEEDEVFEYNEIPEEDAITSVELSPEEQNPEVIKQRAMFPFLDNEPASNEEEPPAFVDSQDSSDESVIDDGNEAPIIEETENPVIESEIEEDNDEPPFEIDSKTIVAEKSAERTSAAVIPVNEAKNEKKEVKKADYSNYVFPSIELLGKDIKNVEEDVEGEIQENADKLIETLASFNVTASIKGVDRGPRITRYEVVPARGVKVSSVMNLQDDIALGLAADGIRMEAPIPGKSAIGVEIPNIHEETVRLRELLETEDFINAKSKTTICIGKDVTGQPVINDIAKMPHLLIAGATGMGKSVCINSLMISILYKARPDEVKFIMIDPKQVEFTMYNGIPHLLVPVVSDAKQAAGALMWAVEEMERRYNQLNTQYVRNVDAYNEKVKADPSIGEPMSRIVIVIDEFADLMLQVRDPVENLVMRIAQKARAAGIHLIIGTQRPAVNVITGTIKANVPSRISCKVASNTDSRTVLDAGGAEKLLNKGDMLFSFAGAIKPLRVQGAFVKDSEVEAIMKYLQQFSNGQSYDQSVMEEIERAAQKCAKKGSGGDDRNDDGDEGSGEGYLNDRQFLDAVELAVNSGRIATSLIQRKLSIGYGKAAKFIDIMEDMGIVGEGNGPKPREVLISADEWREKLARSMID